MSENNNPEFRPQPDGHSDDNFSSSSASADRDPAESGLAIPDPQAGQLDADLPEIGDTDSSVTYPPTYPSPADRNPTVFNTPVIQAPSQPQPADRPTVSNADTGPIRYHPTPGSHPVQPSAMPVAGPTAAPAPMPHPQNNPMPIPMPHPQSQPGTGTASWSPHQHGIWSSENTGQFRAAGATQGSYGQPQQHSRSHGSQQYAGQPGPAQPQYFRRPTDTRAIGSYSLPGSGGTAVMPRLTAQKEDGRARRSVVLVAATVVLALGAGIGGGFIGANISDSRTATATAATDTSLTQQSAAETASANAPVGSVEQVADKVLPSVVSVIAVSDTSGGEGSGVILTGDGYILTNNHVVTGATDLTVRFNDGSTATAKIIGTDPTSDLAVIKVEGVSGLIPATLGTSADLVVGEQVVAIGTPLGLSATVTTGIVSALNRPVRTASEDSGQQQQLPGQQGQSTTASSDTVLNAIQTDAAINPGNSGGPLVDMDGKIVGINSAIASLSRDSTSQSGSIGVGFAIPIDSAARVAQEIIKNGAATHAVLGASVSDATSKTLITTGAQIGDLTAGGPAAAAGLQVGDVVTKINGVPIESSDALVATIRSSAPGEQIEVTLLRNNSTETVTVTLGTATN